LEPRRHKHKDGGRVAVIDAGSLRFLKIAVGIQLAGGLGLLLTMAALGAERWTRGLAPSFLALTALTSLYLIRRGRITTALKVFVYLDWIAVSAGCLLNGGLRSPGSFAFPVIVIMAGWLIGQRAAIALTALTVAMSGGFVLAEHLGLLQPGTMPPHVWIWAAETVVLLIAAGLGYMVAHDHRVRHDRERLHAEELAAHLEAIEAREAELRKSEDRFAKAFHASPTAISLARIEDGRFIDANRAYIDLFGWSREELLGHTSLQIGLWPSEAERNRWRDRLLTEGSTHAYEAVLTGKTGERRDVLISAERIDLAGEDCVLAQLFDITERKRADAELRRLHDNLELRVRERTVELTAANQELESFAYSISHDLRAPLRGIDGFSQVLKEEYGERLDETGNGYLKRIRMGAQRLGDLIDDLLEMSRVTRQEMRRQQVNLSRLAREAIDDLRRGEPERNIRVQLRPDCLAWGDPALLGILMQNLMGNAWKYTRRTNEASIDFDSRFAGGEIVFKLADNGAGFDMAHAGKLFQPFQRLHHPNEFEGTGIGLASVARIVRRHGGRIWAESAPGQGASFHFTLSPTEVPQAERNIPG
jgi:PAS domain S-box-containing protein